ncbi:MAG: nucleotidyltransferase domain-containing protein [archaeon]|nr:nucleotidyltransferase domain-containing protein [archaeon]MCP8313058.1 nucleotidyltransferase domain-containing protein [archaeon]MCP8321596.1 nucleotidyltransferase domain-containing protein [archaeon]
MLKNVFVSLRRQLRLYEERLEILKNWKEYVKRIAGVSEKLLEGCEVYVFGSAIKGMLTAASDIDVLIVTENLPKKILERARVKDEIERLACLPPYHPIQIHLLTKEEAKHSSIYYKIIKESIRIA